MNTDIRNQIAELKRQLIAIWGQQEFIKKYSNEWYVLEEQANQLGDLIDDLDRKAGSILPADWRSQLYNNRI